MLATAALATGCSGAMGLAQMGERSSGALMEFSEHATETDGRLLAYDPAQHSLDIEIAFPLDQPDDIDVYIVTSNGIRFHILSSFQDCHVDGKSRLCSRELPVMPEEGLENWRVEAERDFPTGASSVEVDVTWVPIRS